MESTIQFCEIENHVLEKYEPEMIGDGTTTVVLSGLCIHCKLDIQMVWSLKDFYYAVRIPEYDVNDGIIYEKTSLLK